MPAVSGSTSARIVDLSSASSSLGSFVPNALYSSAPSSSTSATGSSSSYRVFNRKTHIVTLDLVNDRKALPVGSSVVGTLSPTPKFNVTHGAVRMHGDDSSLFALVIQTDGNVVLTVDRAVLAKNTRLHGRITWMQQA